MHYYKKAIIPLVSLVVLLLGVFIWNEAVLPFQIQKANRLICQKKHEQLERYVKQNRFCVKSWPFLQSLFLAVTDNIPVQSPLATACKENDSESVAILLRYGADPNFVPVFQTVGNYTPLCLAASRGNVQAMSLLLENGADVSAQGGCAIAAFLMHRTNSDAAGIQELQSVIELLEQYGYTMPTSLGDDSPMVYAAIYGDVDAMQLLLSGYSIDANAQGNDGKTILHMYIKSGHHAASVEKVKAILDMGTNADIQDDAGKTAYDYAVANGYEDIARLLSNNR